MGRLRRRRSRRIYRRDAGRGLLLHHLQKSASSLLKHYSNNALLFTVMKSALSRPNVGWVSNGQIALAAKEGLYHFKTSMGFQIHPFKEQVVFNPVIRPVYGRAGR